MNLVIFVFHSTCAVFGTDLFPMSSPSCASLCVTTMASDPEIFFTAPWFKSREVRGFPVAGYVDVNGILPDPLRSGHLEYFERHNRCTFVVEKLVWVERRWDKGSWGPRTNLSLPRRCSVELVVLKLDLINGPRWRIPPFKCNLWGACDELVVRYVDAFLGIMPLIPCWTRGPVVEAVPEAMLWREQLFSFGYRWQKKSGSVF